MSKDDGDLRCSVLGKPLIPREWLSSKTEKKTNKTQLREQLQVEESCPRGRLQLNTCQHSYTSSAQTHIQK